jgi:hypothetical protein
MLYILLIFLISAATLELTASRLIRPSRVSERLPNWSAGMKINLIHALCTVHVCHAQNNMRSSLQFAFRLISYPQSADFHQAGVETKAYF